MGSEACGVGWDPHCGAMFLSLVSIGPAMRHGSGRFQDMAMKELGLLLSAVLLAGLQQR